MMKWRHRVAMMPGLRVVKRRLNEHMRKNEEDRDAEILKLHIEHKTGVDWTQLKGQWLRSFGSYWKITGGHMETQRRLYGEPASFQSTVFLCSRLNAREAMCLSTTGSLD